jgi:hypothetical protein
MNIAYQTLNILLFIIVAYFKLICFCLNIFLRYENIVYFIISLPVIIFSIRFFLEYQVDSPSVTSAGVSFTSSTD